MTHVAESLLIDQVMEPATGELLAVRALLPDSVPGIVTLRHELEDAIAAGTPRYVCPVCAAAVSVRSAGKAAGGAREPGSFHFWHGHANRECPLSQRGGASPEQILAAKYHGQRESRAHRELKALVRECLELDRRFTQVREEARWQARDGDPRHWRKPDVRALYRGRPIVFEIQLSTTFVSVMAERRQFYREEGALLVWILADFSAGWQPLAKLDIFYPNNANAFVADATSRHASIEAGAFHLQAHWQLPFLAVDGSLARLHRHALVDFGRLTLEFDRQRAYFVDVEGVEADVRAEAVSAPLRQRFEQAWFRRQAQRDLASLRASAPEWTAVLQALDRFGIALPEDRTPVHLLLRTLYSVRQADSGTELVGWGHADLVKLGHELFNHQKWLLWPFRQALAAYGRGPLIARFDATGSWRKRKVPVYLQGILDDELDYRMPAWAPPLIALLFPPLAAGIAREPSDVLAEEGIFGLR